MQVQRVAVATRVESWTVLGDDDVPVPPIEWFLAYLTDIDRSPNTVKAYAHDLKDYWVFLTARGLDWREVRLEDVAEFAAWLRLPLAGRTGGVVLLPSAQPHVGASTINRKLAALAAFYAHHARSGTDLGDLLTTWRPGHRGGWKPLLHHITKGSPQRRRTIVMKAPRKLPRVLTVEEVQSILDACGRLRDRFLFALLWDSGMRIGEALGMRHDDVDVAARSVTVMLRQNANGARSKSFEPRTIPVSAQLIRLWGDYLHQEYGDIDSDYLFVNLFAEPRGQAWSYAAAYDLVQRLRARTGIRLRPALVAALDGHQSAARRCAHRGCVQVVGPCFADNNYLHLWSSDRAGRSPGAGGSRLVQCDRDRGDPVTDTSIAGGGNRPGFQRHAARELVRMLSDTFDLPVITWTVGLGPVLVGRVSALAPIDQVVASFETWRRALNLVRLTPVRTGDEAVTFMTASGVINQVKVHLVATVLTGEVTS